MKIDECTITTVALSDVEETALTLARHLLDEVEVNLFRRTDTIENADTGEVIEHDDLDIARNLLDVLLNDRHPTRWERHD